MSAFFTRLEKSASSLRFALVPLWASDGAQRPGPDDGSSAPEGGGRSRRPLLQPVSQLREATRSPRARPADDRFGLSSGPDEPMLPLNENVVARALGKFLPAHVTKCMQKQAQDLRSTVQAPQQTNDRKRKLVSEVAMLSDGEPPGAQKVSCTFETSLLDSPVQQTGVTWQITEGDTI